jgi:hypothetical protein
MWQVHKDCLAFLDHQVQLDQLAQAGLVAEVVSVAFRAKVDLAALVA